MRKNGFALAIVVMIILIVMILLFATVALAQNNILFVGNFEHRAAALYAAEAGVAKAIYLLESDQIASALEEDLVSSQARYEVLIDNPNPTTPSVPGPYQDVTISSTGIAGPYRRKLQVKVRRAAGSFNALSNEGPIFLSRDVFANGITSLQDPKMDTGNIHTNNSDTLAINADNTSNIDITGLASAMGGITDRIDPDHVDPTKNTIPIQDFDKASYLSNTFTQTTIPATGIVSQNTVIDNNLGVMGLLTLQNGAILHVKGDLELANGVMGKGSIIVEGKCIVRGTTNIETNNLDGVVVYSEGDLILCSPDAIVNSSGELDYDTTNTVAVFFASMPYNSAIYIAHNLPNDAPRGIGFFQWYKDNLSSPSPDFNKWRNGEPENPVLCPGLPQNVKDWLDQSPAIINDLNTWYNG